MCSTGVSWTSHRLEGVQDTTLILEWTELCEVRIGVRRLEVATLLFTLSWLGFQSSEVTSDWWGAVGSPLGSEIGPAWDLAPQSLQERSYCLNTTIRKAISPNPFRRPRTIKLHPLGENEWVSERVSRLKKIEAKAAASRSPLAKSARQPPTLSGRCYIGMAWIWIFQNGRSISFNGFDRLTENLKTTLPSPKPP